MMRTHFLRDGSLQTVDGAEARGWVEVSQPTDAERAELASKLGLHELAIEDALRRGHPPKLEAFDDHLFVIVHTPILEEDEPETRKLALFLSKTWLVTVQRAPLDVTDEIGERVRRDPARYLAVPAALAHAIVDHMVDGFELLADSLVEQVEALQDETFRDPRPEHMGSILSLRSDVGALARTLRSQRDVCHALARAEHAVLPKKLVPYLRDVYDHVLRVYDLIEGVREGLGAARDGYLASVNNRLSESMRVLTIIATVMMPLSLLAGVYGMNFESMPGVSSPLGFWILVGAMVCIGGSMVLWFRHRRWF